MLVFLLKILNEFSMIDYEIKINWIDFSRDIKYLNSICSCDKVFIKGLDWWGFYGYDWYWVNLWFCLSRKFVRGKYFVKLILVDVE